MLYDYNIDYNIKHKDKTQNRNISKKLIINTNKLLIIISIIYYAININ